MVSVLVCGNEAGISFHAMLAEVEAFDFFFGADANSDGVFTVRTRQTAVLSVTVAAPTLRMPARPPFC
jgi:hypothetical protein